MCRLLAMPVACPAASRRVTSAYLADRGCRRKAGLQSQQESGGELMLKSLSLSECHVW